MAADQIYRHTMELYAISQQPPEMFDAYRIMGFSREDLLTPSLVLKRKRELTLGIDPRVGVTRIWIVVDVINQATNYLLAQTAEQEQQKRVGMTGTRKELAGGTDLKYVIKEPDSNKGKTAEQEQQKRVGMTGTRKELAGGTDLKYVIKEPDSNKGKTAEQEQQKRVGMTGTRKELAGGTDLKYVIKEPDSNKGKVSPDVDIDEVARRTEGYSGDDLTNVCRDASLNGMRRKIAGKTRDEIKNMSKDDISKDPVAMCDFDEAIKKVQPSVSQADIEKHEKRFSEFGSA